MSFRGLVDRDARGRSRGVEVDEDGNGVLRGDRLSQPLREHEAVREWTVEITCLGPGAEPYAFAFG